MKSIEIKFISLLFGILAMFASVNMAYSSKLQVPLIYSPPLGYTSSSSYGPYPLTIFGSQNPNLLNIDTCFLDEASVPIKWPILFHAGTDWFELNGNSAAGDSVTAIADGVVEWVSGSTANYPGAVVIIRHADPDLGTLYSVYMHLIAYLHWTGSGKWVEPCRIPTRSATLADRTWPHSVGYGRRSPGGLSRPGCQWPRRCDAHRDGVDRLDVAPDSDHVAP